MANSPDSLYLIKSFKHNGRVHRMWLENWRVPTDMLQPVHRDENMYVFVNSHTKIVEADGRQWISKIPGVSFFIPGQWFNAIGLIEEQGVRFYCNIASPPYLVGQVLTYIDYDLDVLVSASGTRQVIDQGDYERHKLLYHYNDEVQRKVELGLDKLLDRIEHDRAPLDQEAVMHYFKLWKTYRGVQGDANRD